MSCYDFFITHEVGRFTFRIKRLLSGDVLTNASCDVLGLVWSCDDSIIPSPESRLERLHLILQVGKGSQKFVVSFGTMDTNECVCVHHISVTI